MNTQAESGPNYAWLIDYLDLWSRYHAGEFTTGRGAGGSPFSAYNENHDMPKCTVGDVNGTAFDSLMMDIDKAVSKLPPSLRLPIECYFKRSMGKPAAAQACGVSKRGFDGRLAMAYYHLARFLGR